MAKYHCNQCGAAAYYDGRCGDGPVLLCGCDRRGPVAYDSRGGSVTEYYPSSTARAVEGGSGWCSQCKRRGCDHWSERR